MFPQKKYSEIKNYCLDYFHMYYSVGKNLDFEKIDDVCNLILQSIKEERNIFIIGNGGSAAIANHMLCDLSKGVSTNTNFLPKICSLSSSPELITAIANDLGSEFIFSKQLELFFKPKDICIAISSSGNSPNIIKAIEFANKNSIKSIGLSGFDGGILSKISDISIHIDIKNYGLVEDMHQSIFHIISHFIRMKNLDPKLNIEEVKF